MLRSFLRILFSRGEKAKVDRGAPELFLNQSFAPRRDSLVVGTKIISSRQKRRIGASFVGIPSR